ncbi:MAG: SAM-dependent methyltransferase, partial [Alphaproteobacteria bacterium]|nr:SAM-dependent methyltransferase [Alphaproteobacteria bacterium]
MLFAHLLDHLVTIGTLRVTAANGQSHVFAGAPGPAIAMRLHDPALNRKLFLNPRLHLGEAYMDGTLTVEDGTIYDLLDFFALNIEHAPRHPLRPLYSGFGNFFRRLQQYNPV